MPARPHFLLPLLKSATAAELRLADGRLVAARAAGAFDSAARRRGLLGRASMEPDEALVIAPTSAVHTFGMRFPIDLIYTDRAGRVLKVCDSVRPWRVSIGWGAFAVIELPAGTVRTVRVARGDTLQCVAGRPPLRPT
jgi:uncharacterized membrane protein (UPF0127 family)